MTNTKASQLFPRASFVGFDHLLDELDFISRHAKDNYPPHNIVKRSATEYSIELACAGFEEDDLGIEQKERSLSVSGESKQPEGGEYLHKGISTKKFRRTFRLSEYVEVDGASYSNGILVINLKVVLPEEKRPRKISIT
jgi:molecular chaperone IbpA